VPKLNEGKKKMKNKDTNNIQDLRRHWSDRKPANQIRRTARRFAEGLIEQADQQARNVDITIKNCWAACRSPLGDPNAKMLILGDYGHVEAELSDRRAVDVATWDRWRIPLSCQRGRHWNFVKVTITGLAPGQQPKEGDSYKSRFNHCIYFQTLTSRNKFDRVVAQAAREYKGTNWRRRAK